MTDDVYGFHNTDLGRAIEQADPSYSSRIFKRGLDLTGSFLGLLALIPLFTFLAIAIKSTSKGPVLFKQKRHGLNGKVFTTYKFRSMYVDHCDASGVRQTVKDDPRITPIGRFLRRSNFDELPQLINVFKGEMSLVGPRPHVPGMLANGMPYEEFDPRYQLRHRIKPGITGLAQVNGFRGETRDAYAASMRLYYDLKYIEVRSTLLDLKIIINTVIQEFFKGKGY
ncbi:sugar transferase [uncultured Roseibium sp.]|uniref:sugar transferase n=1 Tax=uncultured Roseibium sp. TaxID=1936171 RepID=UPI002605D18D|nr:sugar transferase [uncultured Roseibium sp.]